MPKRRLVEEEEEEEEGEGKGPRRENGHSASPEPKSKRVCDEVGAAATAKNGRQNGRHVGFAGVTAFFFPREQGFCAVPSSGGTALGMAQKHAQVRRMSLAEAAAQRRLAHERQAAVLNGQGNHQHGHGESEEEDEDEEEDARHIHEDDDGDETESSDEVEDIIASEKASANCAPGKAAPICASVKGLEWSLDESHSSVESGEEVPSEEEEDEGAFFQPLTAKARLALLRASGVSAEVATEKAACAEIRSSRQSCGCSCEGVCEAESCECAVAGIRCQVDRVGFPCACSAETCANPAGRIQFDPVRVRSHYLHTMLRLRMEAGGPIAPSRHLRFASSHAPSSNAIPTTWDPSEGPAILAKHDTSADSGIHSPPVALHSLYAHQTSREDSKLPLGNGYHKVDAAESV